MKKCSGPDPKSSTFPHRLNAYALAAGAAGISLLALAEPSSAEIIYTKTNQTMGKEGTLYLDLNRDGITDVTIENRYHRHCNTLGTCFTSASLAALAPGSNQVVYNAYGAVAMKAGMGIGPLDAFKGGKEQMAFSSHNISHAFGSWVNVTNRYLGVKFNIKGETHYGWVRLTVQTLGGLIITPTLTGYAYETLPNTPITAGKTQGSADTNTTAGSLGRLALGCR
jgi:hypothetical protein